MAKDEVEVASPSCEGERASERTARLEFEGKMRDAEIAHLERALKDLIEEVRWLRAGNAPKWETPKRLAEQVQKLRGVERKLFHLRQRRLL